MRIDLDWFAAEYANLEADEKATQARYAAALDWRAHFRAALETLGQKRLREPSRPELRDEHKELVQRQRIVTQEIRDLRARKAKHAEIRGLIKMLAANVGLTIADLEQPEGEWGHA